MTLRDLKDKALLALGTAVLTAAFALALAAYAKAVEADRRVASLEASLETHVLYIRETVQRIERKVDALGETR